jgi:ethanolamine utilization protein EutN
MVRSREAALAMDIHTFVPVDLALIGIVDELVVHPDEQFDITLKKGTTKYT